jgi:molecular chaperone HscB
MPFQILENAGAECWACHSARTRAKLLCGECGKVQATTEANYFEVFGLSLQLDLDTAKLEEEFYRLSRRLHPDLFARASGKEQQWSLENTSLLNDAYRTLKDPIKRTMYLLKLEGAEFSEEDRERTNQVNPSRVPADLLEEAFELNMQLEEMRTATTAGESDPQLRKDLEAARTQFEGLLNEADEGLKQLWSEWDNALAQNDEAAKSSAKKSMIELLDRRCYLQNLVRDVRDVVGA